MWWLVLLPSLVASTAQEDKRDANAFLVRTRRANGFGFEEMKAADKERECVEEVCDVNEANELLQNPQKAERFIRKMRNQCEQKQCYEDGTQDCINSWGERKCICKPGWTSDDCSLNIDECKEHLEQMKADKTLEPMCKNDGECYDANPNDNPRGFRCRCKPGWTGVFCEIDINECVDGYDGKHKGINPCKNKAICFNTVGSYSCTCSSDFRGDNCKEDIDQCAEDPHLCKNNGICVNTAAGFECACVDGYGGMYCDEAEKECEIHGESPCPPGTRCVDQANGFLCMCPRWGCKHADNSRIRELYYKKYGFTNDGYDFKSYDASYTSNDQYITINE